jgi:hypothetical protein
MFGIDPFSANRRARRAGRGLATRRPTRPRGRRSWTVETLEDRTLLATYTVTNLGDTGMKGDLRYCINQVNANPGDDGIDFQVVGTITLKSALPDLRNDGGVTIIAPGAPALVTVARSSAAGTPAFRIFTVAKKADVLLDDLTIKGGSTVGLNSPGGCIQNDGLLTVNGCIIANNSADNGGGINNGGTLTVTNSTIAYNSAKSGGGILNLS